MKTTPNILQTQDTQPAPWPETGMPEPPTNPLAGRTSASLDQMPEQDSAQVAPPHKGHRIGRFAVKKSALDQENSKGFTKHPDGWDKLIVDPNSPDAPYNIG